MKSIQFPNRINLLSTTKSEIPTSSGISTSIRETGRVDQVVKKEACLDKVPQPLNLELQQDSPRYQGGQASAIYDAYPLIFFFAPLSHKPILPAAKTSNTR